LSNWACLFTAQLSPTVEVAIVGQQFRERAQALHRPYFPNKVMAATGTDSDLPLLQHRAAKADETWIYICRNQTCQLPVRDTAAALELIGKS
jgi:uncharacterized protein YyaL (SSP411 family)